MSEAPLHLTVAPSKEGCDFCSYGEPLVKDYQATSFEMFQPNIPGLTLNSEGEWAACEACADLIDRDDWPGLVERAVQLHEEHVGKQSPEHRLALANHLDIHFGMFRAHRIMKYGEIEKPVHSNTFANPTKANQKSDIPLHELKSFFGKAPAASSAELNKLGTGSTLMNFRAKLGKHHTPNFFRNGVPMGIKMDGALEELPMKEPLKPTRGAYFDPNERILVRAQNVHDYFINHHKEHGWEDLVKFTSVRMPYPKMLITYEHTFRNVEGVINLRFPDDKYDEMGFINRHMDLVLTERSREWFQYYIEPESTYKKNLDQWTPKITEEHRKHMREIVEALEPDRFIEVQCWADFRKFCGRWYVMLDETGQVLCRNNYAFFYIIEPDELLNLVNTQEKGAEWATNEFSKAFGRHGAICLATIQFMNCRNVEIINNKPTRQQIRNAERQGKRPPVTYKTLRILPFRKVAKPTGTHSGTEMSLHICRGHFKNFKAGPGLGKFHAHGLWWWHPQVRGKEEQGRVVKDYEVSPEETHGKAKENSV